jgi:hypothetical protein
MHSKLSKRVLKNHVAISSRGEQTRVTYFAPSHPNDLKRIGRELTIQVGKASITLDGKGIRSLEKVLDEVYYS